MIEGAERLARTPVHEAALACVEAGIDAAQPAAAVRTAVALDGNRLAVGEATYDLGRFDDVIVLGGGKAAAGVAAALESILGDRLTGGAVVVPDDVALSSVEVVVGGHPLPDEGSVAGARRLLALAVAADERTLVLAVVTGGASAMLAAPAEGVDLDDLRAVTRAMLDAGVDIDGVNAVRKHCSAIKGGQLARAAAPATVVGLLVSDVVGDDPGVVASGPTAPDATTFADALAVLDRDGVDAPRAVRRRLEAGARGAYAETPKPGDAAFERVSTVVVANAWTAIEAAAGTAASAGYDPCVLSTRVRGEAREAALCHVAVAEEVAATGHPVAPPAALLSGGETTVAVCGSGSGGPNLEFALQTAIALRVDADRAAGPVLPSGTVLASVDTDGEDGSTVAAGAVVDANTVEDVSTARRALDDNDAYGYLESRGALVRTGPTGTNVNDLRVLLVPG